MPTQVRIGARDAAFSRSADACLASSLHTSRGAWPAGCLRRRGRGGVRGRRRAAPAAGLHSARPAGHHRPREALRSGRQRPVHMLPPRGARARCGQALSYLSSASVARVKAALTPLRLTFEPPVIPTNSHGAPHLHHEARPVRRGDEQGRRRRVQHAGEDLPQDEGPQTRSHGPALVRTGIWGPLTFRQACSLSASPRRPRRSSAGVEILVSVAQDGSFIWWCAGAALLHLPPSQLALI